MRSDLAGTSAPPDSWIRIVAAVIVGFVAWTVLFLGSNSGILALAPGAFNPDGSIDSTSLLVLFLALSIVFSVVAGWIASKIARSRSFGSCVVLGVLLLAVGVMVQIQYWDVMPVWYHIGFLGMLIPGVLLGYRIAVPRGL